MTLTNTPNTPQQFIQILKEGNKIFANGQTENINYIEQIHSTKLSQKPFAVILSCMDSRMPISIIFNQGIGCIYNLTIAGNFVNEDILASLELACLNESVKLISVIGHNDCSAIKNAYYNNKTENISKIYINFEQAITTIHNKYKNQNTLKKELIIEKIADKNVEITINKIYNSSKLINKMVKDKKIILTGGMYNTLTGLIKFKYYKY